MNLVLAPEEQEDIDSSFEALEDTCIETAQERVLFFIETTLSAAISSVQSLRAPTITLRTIKDVHFSENLFTNLLERQIIDREVTYSFPGRNKDEANRFGILLEIYGAILNGVTATKRDIYYQDPQLYKQQSTVDRYVDDIAYTCRATRKDLNVTASPNGLVAGLRRPDHLTDGLDKSYQIICDLDLNSENLEQTLLPHVTCILVVEKEATFNTLVQRSFHTNPALGGHGLLVTGKGYPDLTTRGFLRACLDHFCWNGHPPPIFGLFDCDPHGLGILQNYRLGSIRLAHEVASTVPELKWLGLKTDEIVIAGEDAAILRLTGQDRAGARGLLHRQVSHLDAVSQEVAMESQRMLTLNKKAEIQILDERPGGLCQWLQHKLWHEMHGPA